MGRQIARTLLVGALILDGMAAFILLNGPNTIGPMFVEPPSASSVLRLVPAVGFVVNLVGLAWMVRILRADPEAHPSWWRAVRSH